MDLVSPQAVKRGEIWLVNLDPTVGSEIQKSRPCVVISPPEMHDHLRTAMIAPMNDCRLIVVSVNQSATKTPAITAGAVERTATDSLSD